MNTQDKDVKFRKYQVMLADDLLELDGHIINIIGWLYDIEALKNKIRESGQDEELFHDLDKICIRLHKEIGIRVSTLIPDIRKRQ